MSTPAAIGAIASPHVWLPRTSIATYLLTASGVVVAGAQRWWPNEWYGSPGAHWRVFVDVCGMVKSSRAVVNDFGDLVAVRN